MCGVKLHYSCAKIEKLFERNNKNGVKSFAINEFSLLLRSKRLLLFPQNDVYECGVAKLKIIE